MLNITTLKASADYSEHPAAEDIAKCRLTYEYREIDKCLKTLGYKQVPWHYFPERCGVFYKFEGRDREIITVVGLDPTCAESGAKSRRWWVNCKNKEVYAFTSDGKKTFFGGIVQGSTLNYACYVFHDTEKVVQP